MVESENGSGTEVTLFRPDFAKTMLIQKADEAGFFTAMDASKWEKLVALLSARGIGFYHADPEAMKIILDAAKSDKNVSVRLRSQQP